MTDVLRELVLPKLEGVRKQAGYYMALCPAHDDRTPSLSIKRGNDQPVVFNCHVGCERDQILDALGLTWPDLCKPQEDKGWTVCEEWTPFGPAIAVYDYPDEQRTLLYQVLRTADKQFPCRRPDRTKKSGWTWSLGETRRVLYRLPDILDAVKAGRPIFVVEGEKDVHSVERQGAVATCSPGGAGKWKPEYSQPLRGARVTIVADKDAPGRAHALKVADSLKGVAKNVCIVEAAAGKDATDHFEAGFGLDAFVDPFAQAPQDQPSVEPVGQDVLQTMAGAEPAQIIRGIYPSRQALDAMVWSAPGEQSTGPLPAFPVWAFPGDVGEFVVAAAEYHQISVDVAALVALGAISVVTGGHAMVTGQWTEKTLNLYLAPLADSGEGKSPLVNRIAEPVRALEKELRASHAAEYGHMEDALQIALKSRDRLITRIADAPDRHKRTALKADLEDVRQEISENTHPPRPQLLAGDISPEALGQVMYACGGHIGMLSAEGGFLGTLAGRYTKGVANIDLVLTSFDAQEPYRLDRVGRESFEIERPSFSMCLCVQPVVIEEAVQSNALMDRGLLYRFLFALPGSLAGYRDKRPPQVPDKYTRAWDGCIRDAHRAVLPDGKTYDADGQPRPPVELGVSEAAEEAHYLWRLEMERRVNPDDGDLAAIKGWAKKLEGAVYRIAALLHLAAGKAATEPISEHTMNDAIGVGEWAIPHALAVLMPDRASVERSLEEACRNVLAWIRRQDVAEFTVDNARAALRGRSWVKAHGADGVRSVLASLAGQGYLASVQRLDSMGRSLPDGLFVTHPEVRKRPGT